MKHANASSASPGGLSRRGGSSPILDYMKARQLPLTRENYVALNWPEGAPSPLPAELEQEMPAQFRTGNLPTTPPQR